MSDGSMPEIVQNPTEKFITLGKLVEIPSGFVGIFHKTVERDVDSILKEGLKPQGNHSDAAEEFIDGFSTSGVRRSTSVFANPALDGRYGTMGWGDAVLTVVVDPTKVNVYNGETITEVKVRLQRESAKEAEEFARDYWEHTMTLAEYLALTQEERDLAFTMPEVVIPDGVLPEFLHFTHKVATS